jgi:HlyD family secretion protein
MKKFIWIFVALLLILSVIYFFLPDEGQNNSVDLKTAKVIKGELKLSVAATGVVKPHIEVEVKSKAGGEITSFTFEEGDFLNKGRVVVKLDPEIEQSRVRQAEADLLLSEAKLEKAEITYRDAERRLKRKKSLFENELISREDFDDAMVAVEKAVSDVKIAEAERIRSREALREARDRLKDTNIKAPLTGTILKKYVEEGQVISSTLSSASEGTLLFSMADLNKIYINALVDETDIGRVEPEQRVSITVEAHLEADFNGQVIRIAPKGRTESTITVFDVTVEVDDSQKSLLKPMMTANVEILTDLIKDALLIPSEAVRVKDKKTGVHVLSGNKVIWKPVTQGKTDGILTVIHDGIQEEDEVVISGLRGKKNFGSAQKLRRGFWFFGRKR